MDLALNNLQRLICHETQPTIPLHQSVGLEWFDAFMMVIEGTKQFLFLTKQIICCILPNPSKEESFRISALLLDNTASELTKKKKKKDQTKSIL